MAKKKKIRPRQRQRRQPGIEAKMKPRPKVERPSDRRIDRLTGKVALVSGGDSGIGRAVAVAVAREGADVAILYLDEHRDAAETRQLVEKEGRRCLAIAGDIGDERFCRRAVERAVRTLGKLDILVNNAAEQHERSSVTKISAEQLQRTFRTNVFGMFFLTKAALRHLKKGASIINSTSVTAYRGSPKLIDYAATKGAIVSFTRSLAKSLVEKGIRVNAVAPGPVWTPLIPASFSEKRVEEFGSDKPMGRAAEPAEIAPSYVFLACEDASFFSGQVLHPNGGEVVNG